MSRKAIILKDKLGNKLYPAAYKDDMGNVIRQAYQGKLISGYNIKTINGESILGGGNLILTTTNFTEYATAADFPATGESGKIFLALDTKKIYRWTGTAYEEISPEATVTVEGTGNAITNITDSNGALTATKGGTFVDTVTESGSGNAIASVSLSGSTVTATKDTLLKTVSESGSGNAVTSISASNGAITATKGSTFLTAAYGTTSASPETTMLWLDPNSNNGLKYWNGSQWVPVPVLFG